MKNLNILLMLILFGALMMSCNKDEETADVSTVTEYPVFEMAGDQAVYVEKGSAYVDPGVTASEGGADLQVTKTVVGTYTGATSFDANVSDIYLFTYKATNKDGFSGSVTREVYVIETGDLVNSISGLYLATIVRNDIPKFQDLAYVFISDNNGDNTYNIWDGVGTYYALGFGYGPAYYAPTTVTANDISANDFTFGSTFGVGAFGGTANMVSMVVDPGAKTIDFQTNWTTGGGTLYVFQVSLTQTQF